MHILIVHDDPLFYRELLPLLSLCEASGAFARNLAAACDQIEAQPPQVIILGSASLQEQEVAKPFLGLLEAHMGNGLLVTTAASAESIRAGDERARLEATLTCASGLPRRSRPRYRIVGHLRIDSARQRAMIDGEWVRLPRIQFRILRYLVDHVGELVSYSALMKAGWGLDGETAEARELLKGHLRQIRRRLGPEFLPYLQIVRGEGYVLVNPLEEE